MKLRIAIFTSAFLAFSIFSPILHAQSGVSQAPDAGHGRRGEMFQKLSQALDLTADQKARIKPIMEEMRSQAMAIRDDGSLSRQQKIARIKEIWQGEKEQIKKILTPEQREKLEEFSEKMKERRAQRGN